MDTTRFRTNQKFSKEEQDYVRQLTLKAKDELRDTTKQVIQLFELQNKLSTDISNYDVAIAPWKRVPEHIFQLIFLWCFPPSGLVIPGPDARAFVTLTAVCSSWRKLALNTPELWQAVTVKLYSWTSDRAIPVAHQWLERAGNRARTLRMEANTEDYEVIFDQLVLPFRFRQLDIILGDRHQTCHMTEKILSLPPERAQSLVALRVATLEEKCTAWDSNTEVIFPKDQCPFSNLQILSLRIEGSLMLHQSTATIIPWEQLSQLSLRVENFSPPPLLNILQRCVALEKLKVIMGGKAKSELSALSSITLPNLQRIDLVYFEGGGYPEVFFRSLVLPNIEEFSVRGYALICTSQSFADMAQRSGMDKLQKLYLGEGEEPHHLDHLLKYTPSLTHLEVRGKVVLDSQILEDLLKGRLGPNLQELVARAVFTSGHRVDRLINDLLYFRRTWNAGGVLDV